MTGDNLDFDILLEERKSHLDEIENLKKRLYEVHKEKLQAYQKAGAYLGIAAVICTVLILSGTGIRNCVSSRIRESEITNQQNAAWLRPMSCFATEFAKL